MIRLLIFVISVSLPSIAVAQTAVVLDMGNDTALVIAFAADGTVVIVPSARIIRSGPAPGPTPAANPYPQPTPAMISALESLTQFKLSRADATAIAGVYGGRADKVPATLKTTDELRQALIDAGKLLGMKGRYPGLAEAVEATQVKMLGLDSRATTVTDAVALRATAWKLWELGK